MVPVCYVVQFRKQMAREEIGVYQPLQSCLAGSLGKSQMLRP
jgi:hypothetical protein